MPPYTTQMWQEGEPMGTGSLATRSQLANERIEFTWQMNLSPLASAGVRWQGG